MSGSTKIKEFWQRNRFLIIFCPSLFLLHYGWVKIQENEKFVPKEKQKESPFIRIGRHAKSTVVDTFNSWLERDGKKEESGTEK